MRPPGQHDGGPRAGRARAEECATLRLPSTRANHGLVFHPLFDYLTTSTIAAVRLADNAVADLSVARSPENTQAAPGRAAESVQAPSTRL